MVIFSVECTLSLFFLYRDLSEIAKYHRIDAKRATCIPQCICLSLLNPQCIKFGIFCYSWQTFMFLIFLIIGNDQSMRTVLDQWRPWRNQCISYVSSLSVINENRKRWHSTTWCMFIYRLFIYLAILWYTRFNNW